MTNWVISFFTIVTLLNCTMSSSSPTMTSKMYQINQGSSWQMLFMVFLNLTFVSMVSLSPNNIDNNDNIHKTIITALSIPSIIFASSVIMIQWYGSMDGDISLIKFAKIYHICNRLANCSFVLFFFSMVIFGSYLNSILGFGIGIYYITCVCICLSSFLAVNRIISN